MPRVAPQTGAPIPQTWSAEKPTIAAAVPINEAPAFLELTILSLTVLTKQVIVNEEVTISAIARK